MKPPAHPRQGKRPSPDQVKGLERALDKVYSRLRERARAAWERSHSGSDPADAHVSVRISVAEKSPDFTSTPRLKPNPKPRPLVPKKRPAKKISSPAKDRPERNR